MRVLPSDSRSTYSFVLERSRSCRIAIETYAAASIGHRTETPTPANNAEREFDSLKRSGPNFLKARRTRSASIEKRTQLGKRRFGRAAPAPKNCIAWFVVSCAVEQRLKFLNVAVGRRIIPTNSATPGRRTQGRGSPRSCCSGFATPRSNDGPFQIITVTKRAIIAPKRNDATANGALLQLNSNQLRPHSELTSLPIVELSRRRTTSRGSY